MHNDTNSNAPNSATTSSNRAARTSVREADFLQNEADAALVAIRHTLEEIRGSLKNAGNVTAWTREYPLPSIGVAAAAGFLAARTVSKSHHTEPGPLTALERILTDEQIAGRLRELSDSEESPHRPLFGAIFSMLFKNVIGIFESALVAGLTARSQTNSPEGTSDKVNGETVAATGPQAL